MKDGKRSKDFRNRKGYVCVWNMHTVQPEMGNLPRILMGILANDPGVGVEVGIGGIH